MRYLVLFVMTAAAALLPAISSATDLPLFGPKTYTRAQGKPITVTDTFSGCASGNSGVLRLVNGGGKDTRVSSATVILNGSRVVGEHDLNRNVPSLERMVALKPGDNTLQVTLKSGQGEGDDDDHHDGKDRHDGKDSESKGKGAGKEKERSLKGGAAKDGKDGHHDEHDKGDDDDGHHGEDDDHRHEPVFLTIEILGRNCDAVPPVVSSLQPVDGGLLNVVRPVIAAAYADNSTGSGIDTASVRVSLDGSDITSSCTVTTSGVSCTPVADLADGSHSVSLTVADLSKNSVSSGWSFIIDSKPPLIAIAAPTSDAFVNTPQITVSGSVSETVASLTVNGSSTSPTGLGFSAGTTLVEGRNTIAVEAIDPAGNKGTAVVAVNLDTVPPHLSVSTLSDAAYTNNETLNISGTVTDSGGLDRLLINGVVVPVNPDGSYSHVLILKNGANGIVVEAIDKATNRSSDSRTINLDLAAPQLVVTAPADNAKTGVGLIEISGTVDEQSTVDVMFKGVVQQATVNGNSFTATVIPDYGYNTIEITARDRAGNPSSQKRTVIFDDRKPSVGISEPSQDIRTNSGSLLVKGSATDADGLTAVSVTLTKDGESFTPPVAAGAFEQLVSFGEEKSYAIVATARDEVGNETSVQRNVIYDITPPAVTINPVVTPTNQASQTIGGSREAGATVSVTTTGATINDVAYPTETTWQTTVAPLSVGENVIVVKAADIAGNVAGTTATIILDTVAPQVKITSHANGQYLNTPAIAIAGSVDDPAASLAVNGAVVANGGASWTLAGVTLQEGENSFVVEARDLAGNSGSDNILLNLDTVPPVITVTEPTADAFLNTPQIIVKGSVSEPVISLSVNGQAVTLNGLTFTTSVHLVEGANTVVIEAIDRAGNKATVSVPVNLDTVPPVVTITAPAANLLTNEKQLTISGTVSEPVASLSVGGSVVTVTPALTFTTVLTLTEGAHAIPVIATDRAGNKGNAAISVNLDATPPALPLLETLPLVTNTPETVIRGSAEPGSVVSLYAGTIKLGQTVTDATGTFTFPGVTLPEGESTFTVVARDAAGNDSQPSLPVHETLDTKAPLVGITAPAAGAILGTAVVTISGSIDDPTATITVGGRSAVNNGTSWTLADFTLQEGANSLIAEARDAAGNKGTATTTITLDTVKPAITVTTPAAGAVINTPQITVSGTVSETVVSLTVNGQAVSANGLTFTSTLTLAEGQNTLAVEAVDRAGNRGTTTTTVTLDTAKPVVTIAAPPANALVNTPQLTVSGTVSEAVSSLIVNGISTPLAGLSFTRSVTLAEGQNTITVEAIDRAGNRGTASVPVGLDTVSPTITVTTPASGLLTKEKQLTVGGTVSEAVTSLTVNGAAVAVAANLTFSSALTLAEGESTIAIEATDKAGNKGTASVPVSLDTAPPVVSVTAPTAGTVVSGAAIQITGTVNEPLAALTLNGGVVAVTDLAFSSTLALAEGENSALITATDLAGNVATTTITVRRDATPPIVIIGTPLAGLLTRNGSVQVSGTVDDPEATITVNGAAVTNSGATFSFTYSLSDGDNAISVEAVDKAGNKGAAATTVTLDAIAPALAITAPAEAVAGANVAINLTASDNRGLTLVELKADGMPVWSAGSGPAVAEAISWRLSPALNSGAQVALSAKALDAAGNEGNAAAVIRISAGASGPGYLQGKVLDDSRGLLLGGANVAITDAKGAAMTLTSAVDGGWFGELPSGSALVQLGKDGYTSVERQAAVLPEKKAVAVDARLTAISGKQNIVDATGGTATVELLTSNPAPRSPLLVELTVPPGALPAPADFRLTPVSNQGLAGLLPPGWSPLAVVDIRALDQITAAPLATAFTETATLKLPLPSGLAMDPAAPLTLARYDVASHQWLATDEAAVAADGLSAEGEISVPGQYALVIADPAPGAPPAPAMEQPLLPAASVTLEFDSVTASGRVVPQASPAAPGLKAAGEVVMVPREGAVTTPSFTSGLLLSAKITEQFDLKSGDKVETPIYKQDLVLYRLPCITSIGSGAVTTLAPGGAELRTTFPVSPSRDYTIVDLLKGKVGVEISRPDSSETGVMVGPDGARLVDADGTILTIPAGALAQTVPVATRTAPAATGAVGSDFTLIRAVELSLTNQLLARGATLAIPLPAGLDPSLPLVVARQIDVKGVARLKLVALARISGSLLGSDTTATGMTLSGITTSGVYYFLQAKGQIGFVAGRISDSASAPYTGALVTADSSSLVDLAAASGAYLLAAPVAPFTATALDLYKGDQTSAAGAVTTPYQIVGLDLQIAKIPPTVVAITPSGVNVQPTVPVVVTFSKAMDQGSVTAASLVVRDGAGVAVPGVITWSIDAKAATFYPAEAFKQLTGYSVTVAATVRDLQGYPLGQDVGATFTIRKTDPPPMPPAGNISATFPDADGFITVTATQGSADTGNTVLLINDTSGEISSVTPLANGSFSGRVRGQLGDEIKVVLMDSSGNQTVISWLTFKGADGSYLVSPKGGKVEGEGGSILDIPEGALAGPAIIKLTALPEAGLPSPPQAPGQYLSAFNIDSGGVPFNSEVKLSMPIPAGFDPATPVFLTKPGTVYLGDGTSEQVYEVIDSTKVIDGRITTASPPFDGVKSFGSFVFIALPTVNVGIVSGYTYQEMNDQPGFQGKADGSVETPTEVNGTWVYEFDRPIQGAVIRTPSAWNYVSYSNRKGFYSGMTTLYGNVGLDDLEYKVTATHPLTMQRQTKTGWLNADTNIRNLNFKLAEKNTIQPDKTPPVIEITAREAEGQPPGNRIVLGTMPVNTVLDIKVAVIDESDVNPSLMVTYLSADGSSSRSESAILALNGSRTLVSKQTSERPAIWRSEYKITYPSWISAPETGGGAAVFKPAQPGSYTLEVNAADSPAMNKAQKKTFTVRVVAADVVPGSVDGPPRVDYVTPREGEPDLLTDTKVDAWFSEPVDNVTSDTFKLIDNTTGLAVPATISASFEGTRMRATLAPLGNLAYDRSYGIVITTGIVDVQPNPSAGNAILPLAAGFTGTFSTKRPAAYNMDVADQFQGGKDIALYRTADNHVYNYVAAGDKGWRVVDVTVPTAPKLAFKVSASCSSTPDNPCRGISPYANFRSVAVHPDPNMAIMAMTDNYFWPDGNHYGYIRFYDLKASPIDPPIVGRERLAEAYSGIPGRVALWGDNAYIATANAALQVISITTAVSNVANGEATTDGTSILGVYDSIGEGYGSPNDIFVYGPGKALLTTNPGHLIVLDINNPVPVKIGYLAPAQLNALRVTAAADFTCNDSVGNTRVIDLAITGGGGRIKTVDLSNPYAPRVLATVKDAAGKEVVSYPYDITLNKELGLAIVTTLSAIQLIDVKDPDHPRLLNTITQLADSSTTGTDGALSPIGAIPAIVESDGWIYMIDQNQGVRTLELGGELKSQCDPNFPCSP